jgi:hypothetical protein
MFSFQWAKDCLKGMSARFETVKKTDTARLQTIKEERGAELQFM